MADALISVLLERLASTTYEYIEGGVKIVLNVEEDVEKFTRTLRVIQAVLEDAEQRQVTDQAVKIWLDELKDVSYQMVDVLDEWNTNILKQQVEKQEREGDPNALVTKKKSITKKAMESGPRFLLRTQTSAFPAGDDSVGTFMKHLSRRHTKSSEGDDSLKLDPCKSSSVSLRKFQ